MACVDTPDSVFHYNDETLCWERLDHVQKYRGHVIKTVTWHRDHLIDRVDNHREYIVTCPSGRVMIWPIDKRGGNITDLKAYIDFNFKYNRDQYL